MPSTQAPSAKFSGARTPPPRPSLATRALPRPSATESGCQPLSPKLFKARISAPPVRRQHKAKWPLAPTGRAAPTLRTPPPWRPAPGRLPLGPMQAPCRRLPACPPIPMTRIPSQGRTKLNTRRYTRHALLGLFFVAHCFLNQKNVHCRYAAIPIEPPHHTERVS